METIQTITSKKIEYMMHGNEVIYDGDTIFKKFVDIEKTNIIALIEDCDIEIPIYYKST